MNDTAQPPGPGGTPPDPELHLLLQYLETGRGLSFHGYKPSTLSRRIRKRMSILRIEGYAGYRDYLEAHPEEFPALLDTILINVTGFFRDPGAWDLVRTHAVPRIVASAAGAPIRVWSAGCASGEEAYTIAMLFAEALGEEEFRERVRIYGTDVDEAALAQARRGTYEPTQTAAVPPELLERYFDHAGGLHVLRPALRRQLTFGRHDLLTDAPLSRIDLLVCRNTLMYFKPETQARVINRFRFAVNDGGFLLLGGAERTMAQDSGFTAVDHRFRLCRKVALGRGGDRAGGRAMS